MRLRRGQNQSNDNDDGSSDPFAELFNKPNRNQEKDEGNVTNSMAMLTAIPEVDLGMEWVKHLVPRTRLADISNSTRLKNIEETEKAKRVLTEVKERKKESNNEEHLVATRCKTLLFILEPSAHSSQSIDRTSNKNPIPTSCVMQRWKLWVYAQKIMSHTRNKPGIKWLPTRW